MEEQPLIIMGTAEVAEYLQEKTGQKWDTKKVGKYVDRAREKDFPPGLFPEPDVQLRCGNIWSQDSIDEYLAGRG